MRETVRTLLIDADGLTRKAIAADTFLKGMLNLSPVSPLAVWMRSYRIGQHVWGPRNDFLSYVLDWREAICEAPELEVDVCNATNLVHYRQSLKKIKQYALTVILHSATGDSVSLLRGRTEQLNDRRGKLVVFVGNEYNLLDQKINFLKTVNADYICSQLPEEAANWLYQECVGSRVLSLPHALNPKVYFPIPEVDQVVDFGFIGDLYHDLIGDRERTDLIRFFIDRGKELGLTCDIRSQRLPRAQWVDFLRRCKGMLGAESGTYYLDRTGQRIEGARQYVKTHRKALFEEVHSLFFKGATNTISGKAISSRHFEPVGTRTCQLLIEGKYNGILKANEHYIPVKRDLSNIEEAVRKFKDDAYRLLIANKAYEYVLSSHTYKHRVDSLLKLVLGELPLS